MQSGRQVLSGVWFFGSKARRGNPLVALLLFALAFWVPPQGAVSAAEETTAPRIMVDTVLLIDASGSTVYDLYQSGSGITSDDAQLRRRIAKARSKPDKNAARVELVRILRENANSPHVRDKLMPRCVRCLELLIQHFSSGRITLAPFGEGFHNLADGEPRTAPPAECTGDCGNADSMKQLLAYIAPPTGTLDDVSSRHWAGLTVETLLHGSSRTFVNRTCREALQVVLEHRLNTEQGYAQKYRAQRLVLITDGREEEQGEGNAAFHAGAYESVLAEFAAYRDRLRRMQPPVDFDYREVVYNPAVASQRSELLKKYGFKPASVTGFQRAAALRPNMARLIGDVRLSDLRAGKLERIELVPPLAFAIEASDGLAVPGRLHLMLGNTLGSEGDGVLTPEPAEMPASGQSIQASATLRVRAASALLTALESSAAPAPVELAYSFTPSDEGTLYDPLSLDRIPVELRVRRPATVDCHTPELLGEIPPSGLSASGETRIALAPALAFTVRGSGARPATGKLSLAVSPQPETSGAVRLDCDVMPKDLAVTGSGTETSLTLVLRHAEKAPALPPVVRLALSGRFTPSEDVASWVEPASFGAIPMSLRATRKATLTCKTEELHGSAWWAALQANGQEHIVLQPPLSLSVVCSDGRPVTGRLNITLRSHADGLAATDFSLEPAEISLDTASLEQHLSLAIRNRLQLMQLGESVQSFKLGLDCAFTPSQPLTDLAVSTVPHVPIEIALRHEDAPVRLRSLVRGVTGARVPAGISVPPAPEKEVTGFRLDLPAGAESFARLNWTVNASPPPVRISRVADDRTETEIKPGEPLVGSGAYRVTAADGLAVGVHDAVLELSPANEHVYLDLGETSSTRTLISVRVQVSDSSH